MIYLILFLLYFFWGFVVVDYLYTKNVYKFKTKNQDNLVRVLTFVLFWPVTVFALLYFKFNFREF